MFSDLWERAYGWYSSLTDRDKKILIVFLSLLLPALSIYVYMRQINYRSKMEQKLISLPSVKQLEAQISSLEKQKVYYKQEMSKLSALLLNPSIEYAYNTELNQVSIILNNEVNYYGGYLTSFQEMPPVRLIVDEHGVKSNLANVKNQKNNKNKKPLNQKLFDVELLPVKLTVAVSKKNVLSFLNNFNTPNNVYPLILVKHISFGFGKGSSCSDNLLQDNSEYILKSSNSYNMTLKSPVSICLSGYVVTSIAKVPEQLSNTKGIKNGK